MENFGRSSRIKLDRLRGIHRTSKSETDEPGAGQTSRDQDDERLVAILRQAERQRESESKREQDREEANSAELTMRGPYAGTARKVAAPHRDVGRLDIDIEVKVSVLGRGLSTGTELEYSDSATIKSALENRKSDL